MVSRNGIGGLFETAVGVRGIKIAKYLKLRAQMAMGRAPYTALNGLDKQLLSYLPSGGFFVEAGGNDGVDQSNTFYLEKCMGWEGILIEPFEPLSRLSSRFRSATAIAAALGSTEDEGKCLEMTFSDLMSSKVYERTASPKWGGLFGPNPTTFAAPIRTLSSILDEIEAPPVTLLSLDVEGFELRVLEGLNLVRHRPKFILIETTQPEAVLSHLGRGYKMEKQLSFHDYLIIDHAS
ncbi:FkbM family methyltransferase [Rhizobium grahamii]|nr:FkbM family methyltransferase [Rhizobium grahamii]